MTDYEKQMRLKCCDLWLPIDGAVYRLALGGVAIVELEQVIDCGIGGLWARTPTPPITTRHATAQTAHLCHMLRLALICGGMGVRGGEPFTVTVGMALELSGHVAAGPLAQLWAIARAVADVTFLGRDAAPNEVDAFTIPGDPPIIPAWALEYNA